jgi:hypothetical protein
MTRQDPVEKIIYVGCNILLAAAALNPNAESLWGKHLLVIGIFLLFSVFAINRIARAKAGGVEWIDAPVTLPLVIFLAFIALQLIPVPLQILKVISPLTAFDKLQLQSWLSQFQFSTLPPPNGYSIAYVFQTTLQSWLYALAFAAMFGLTLHGVGSRRQIDILFFILVVSGDLIAMDVLLKMIFSASRSDPNSHLASGVLGMVLPLTAGLFLTDKAPSERSIKRTGGLKDRFHQILDWLSPDSVPFRMFFLLFSAVLMIAALIFANSGGTMISLLFAAVLAAMLTRFRRLPYRALIIGMIGLTGIFLGIHAKYGSLTFLPLTDYPAAGIGWGNFHHLSFRYSLSGNLNTAGISGWLKTFSEIGIAGSFILAGAIAAYLHDFLSTWRQRRDIHAFGIGCGVLMSIFFVGIRHEISADGFSLPELIIFSAILGTGYAAIHRKGHGYTAFFNYPVRRGTVTGKMRILMSLVILSAFVIGSMAVLRKEPAAAASPAGDKNLARAVLLSHLSENPADGILWFELGNLMKQMDDDPYAYLHRYLPAADKAYDIAVYYRPEDEALLFQAADYWVRRSRLLSDPDPNDTTITNVHQRLTRQQGIRIFQEKFRRLLQLNPSLWEKSVDAIWAYFPEDRIVLEIVPEENAILRRDILRRLAQKDSG